MSWAPSQARRAAREEKEALTRPTRGGKARDLGEGRHYELLLSVDNGLSVQNDSFSQTALIAALVHIFDIRPNTDVHALVENARK